MFEHAVLLSSYSLDFLLHSPPYTVQLSVSLACVAPHYELLVSQWFLLPLALGFLMRVFSWLLTPRACPRLVCCLPSPSSSCQPSQSTLHPFAPLVVQVHAGILQLQPALHISSTFPYIKKEGNIMCECKALYSNQRIHFHLHHNNSPQGGSVLFPCH